VWSLPRRDRGGDRPALRLPGRELAVAADAHARARGEVPDVAVGGGGEVAVVVADLVAALAQVEAAALAVEGGPQLLDGVGRVGRGRVGVAVVAHLGVHVEVGGLATGVSPLPDRTSTFAPAGSNATPVGYQPVGMKPRKRLSPGCATSTTATRCCRRSRPEASRRRASASAFGVDPGGAFGESAVPMQDRRQQRSGHALSRDLSARRRPPYVKRLHGSSLGPRSRRGNGTATRRAAPRSGRARPRGARGRHRPRGP
jgi:hypothetical protein